MCSFGPGWHPSCGSSRKQGPEPGDHDHPKGLWSIFSGGPFAGLVELHFHPTTAQLTAPPRSQQHTGTSCGQDLPGPGSNPASPAWVEDILMAGGPPGLRTSSTGELMEQIAPRCLQGLGSNEANHAGKPTAANVCRFRCIKSANSVTFVLPLKEAGR